MIVFLRNSLSFYVSLLPVDFVQGFNRQNNESN